MIGYGLAFGNTKAAPSCALGCLEALEKVEERNRRVGVFGVGSIYLSKYCNCTVSRCLKGRMEIRELSHTDYAPVPQDIPLSTVQRVCSTPFLFNCPALGAGISLTCVASSTAMLLRVLWDMEKRRKRKRRIEVLL